MCVWFCIPLHFLSKSRVLFWKAEAEGCRFTVVLTFPSAPWCSVLCAWTLLCSDCSGSFNRKLGSLEGQRARRDICLTDTKVTFTPSHCLISVLHMERKTTETAASCPVHSETDLSGSGAVNDILGSQPVAVVHVCDDRGSSCLCLSSECQCVKQAVSLRL